MYALPNKTQHKLIVKVRGGISQKLDDITSGNSSSSSQSFAKQAFDETGFNAELSNLPQPIFHSISQNGSKQKSSFHNLRAQKQYITPEHNEMIKYVQSSWKGVERDYKKSVNNFINNLDINNSSEHMKQKQTKKKTATASKPLLLTGSYHHTIGSKNSASKKDSFQPFDLEAFWGNRILKRLTEDA